MEFTKIVDRHGRTMPKGAPPILVAHPIYGDLGICEAGRGFIPKKGRWTSTNAILRDASRSTVKTLRKIEDHAPKFVMGAIASLLARDPMAMPYILGAIASYDNIVTSRGNGTGHDYWCSLTATIGGVTLSWYDTFKGSWTPGSFPSVTAYVNGATGGAVMDAASNGSWMDNASGATKKYIVSVGLTTANITGFSLGILYDCLWAGSLTIVNNTTTNPTTDVAVTRYTGTAAAGNMLMATLTATLTYSAGTPTITVNYVDQAGGTGKSTISLAPATGPLTNRIIYNTAHNSATVNASTPFMPLTNSGSSGVRQLEQISYATGLTITSGAVDHKIVRPLVIMPFISANSYIEQDTTLNIGNMVELVTASQVCGCLSWAVFTGGTTATTMSTMIRTAEN